MKLSVSSAVRRPRCQLKTSLEARSMAADQPQSSYASSSCALAPSGSVLPGESSHPRRLRSHDERESSRVRRLRSPVEWESSRVERERPPVARETSHARRLGSRVKRERSPVECERSPVHAPCAAAWPDGRATGQIGAPAPQRFRRRRLRGRSGAPRRGPRHGFSQMEHLLI
jgi:hypothetical protein